jgi:hypothetical protein
MPPRRRLLLPRLVTLRGPVPEARVSPGHLIQVLLNCWVLATKRAFMGAEALELQARASKLLPKMRSRAAVMIRSNSSHRLDGFFDAASMK